MASLMLLNSTEVILWDDEGNDTGLNEDYVDFNGVECLGSDDARDVRCVEYEDDMIEDQLPTVWLM